MQKKVENLYREFGKRFASLDDWSAYVITACEDTERYIGRKADKKRKIYNGMMKTCYYQFMGGRPPKQRTGHKEDAEES